MKETVIRRASTWVAAFVMTSFGFTSVASAQTITNTGPDSTSRITSTVQQDCTVRNNNRASVSNKNMQSATSGDAKSTDNTTAGASWDGWAPLNPQEAQERGISYTSWNTGVTQWMAQHASGNGWNSTESNLSWMPTSSSWSNWNPMLWQNQGQSFANWYNGITSYLNNNSSEWLLSWPADATGGSSFSGATSGNATNSNNANFTINITNTARAAAGTNECGQSNFTPPPTGGMGGGGTWTPATTTTSTDTHTTVARNMGGAGGGMNTANQVVNTPTAHTSMPMHQSTPAVYTPATTTPAQPCTPANNEPTPPAGAGNIISNTGPGSSNTITTTATSATTVTNTTNVTMTNWNTQSSSTGNATVSGNTATGGATSGMADNGNGAGFNGSFTN